MEDSTQEYTFNPTVEFAPPVEAVLDHNSKPVGEREADPGKLQKLQDEYLEHLGIATAANVRIA